MNICTKHQISKIHLKISESTREMNSSTVIVKNISNPTFNNVENQIEDQ